MTRRTVYGLLAATLIGLVSLGLRQAGYDTWLLTTLIFVAVVARLYTGSRRRSNRRRFIMEPRQ